MLSWSQQSHLPKSALSLVSLCLSYIPHSDFTGYWLGRNEWLCYSGRDSNQEPVCDSQYLFSLRYTRRTSPTATMKNIESPSKKPLGYRRTCIKKDWVFYMYWGCFFSAYLFCAVAWIIQLRSYYFFKGGTVDRTCSCRTLTGGFYDSEP